MKKSFITVTSLLLLVSFSLFSCASKEKDLPDQGITAPEEIAESDVSAADENSSETLESETIDSQETDTSETADNPESFETTESENTEETETTADEEEELEEIIEPEVFEEELPEIIEEETVPQIEEEKAEPLTEEENSEITELETISEELEEIIDVTEDKTAENEDEVIEVADETSDEVESLDDEASAEEDKIDEEEKIEITPSRSVTLKNGESLDVEYPGKGWIYLGCTDGSKNLISSGRKSGTGTTSFTLIARVPGTVILHFYKEDILAGKYIDDFLEVNVSDVKSRASVHVKAPSYSEAVPAKPETKKTEKAPEVKQEPVQEETTETKEPEPEKESEPVTKAVKKVEPVKKPEPAIKPVEPAPKAETKAAPKAEEKKEIPVLSAEEYLSRAKKAIDEKNYTEGYNNLQNFLTITENNKDEGLYLLAGIYEGNSKYRDIKKSVETYEEITNNYPLSKFWDDANKRAIYLKRFYINIR